MEIIPLLGPLFLKGVSRQQAAKQTGLHKKTVADYYNYLIKKSPREYKPIVIMKRFAVKSDRYFDEEATIP